MNMSRSDRRIPDPVVGWRSDIHPPILTIHPTQTRDFIVQIIGMDGGIRVEPAQGHLAVVVESNSRRHVRCPTCHTGDGLAHQEWLYSSRPVMPTLHRVDDPAHPKPIWFLTLAADADSDPDSAFDLTGALAAPFFCRFCARGYTLPPDVHAALPWSLA